MRPDEKEFLGNVLKMSAVAWFVHTFVETPLHEYGHYWAASLLGTPIYIDGERTIWSSTQVVPPLVHALIFFAGGLCAGSVLIALLLVMKTPYRNGLLPLIAAEFAYAPLDGTMIGDLAGLAALLIVWGLVFGVDCARFLGGSRPTPRLDPMFRRAWSWMHGSSLLRFLVGGRRLAYLR